MKQQLLLLQDVEALGQKGDVVSAKPGYVRNYLLPQGFAVIASANTLRKRERLQQERERQAVVDRQEADQLRQQVESLILETRVKVDPEGRMYGSVSALDIANLYQQNGLPVEKRYVQMTRPIKETGVHKIPLKLKEAIPATCTLHIIPEGLTRLETAPAVVAPLPAEESESAEQSE
jgi:large subunit ribosomal protein L9